MTKRIVRIIIALIVFYILYRYLIPYMHNKYEGCGKHQEVYNQSINGRVLQKYVDAKNHNYQTVVFSGINGYQQGSMIFSPEFYDMFDLINVGDSVIKKKSTIYYKVIFKASGKDTIFPFHSICKDSLSNKH
ncbi:MAG TPA: hypothetical protein VIM89_04995 [Mucilaginibacter sp.]